MCINEDVETLYKELTKYETSKAVPQFFSDSMQHNMYCKDVSNYNPPHIDLPKFLCSNYHTIGYEKDEKAILHCINWPGDKNSNSDWKVYIGELYPWEGSLKAKQKCDFVLFT